MTRVQGHRFRLRRTGWRAKQSQPPVHMQNPDLPGKEYGKPKGTGVFTKSIKTSGREMYKRYLIPSLS